jgi:hypothetical protein
MPELTLREELQTEREHLAKAERDIKDGWLRLHRQEQTVADLRSGGHNTSEAERLVELTSKTLEQWERHRSLIEQRILYLKGRLVE